MPEDELAAAGRHRVARQGGSDDAVIDLARGHPDDSLLPLTLLRDAALHRLAIDDASPLQYGAERGDDGFREALAVFLTQMGASSERTETSGRTDDLAHAETPESVDDDDVDPDRLLVTAGASQALDLLCTCFSNSGEIVLVEEPTYHLARDVFADHGLHVVGIPSDAGGIDPDALRGTLEDGFGGRRVAFVYLVPFFGNPTGATLDPTRRRALLDVTAGHDIMLVADEVYRFLPFDGAPPASLAGEARARGQDRVVSLGSFSKFLAPGLRLGWMEADEDVLDRIEHSGLYQSGGGANPFVSALVGSLLAEGVLPAHVRRVRAELARRARTLTAALRREVPGARTSGAAGGYFVWLHVPGTDAGSLLPVARERGVGYTPGNRFSTTGAQHDRFRLSFAHYPPEWLEEATHRLAGVVAQAVALPYEGTRT
ncbi:MAG: PLP-dependent aminotransferase family protein [Trueperaceae bacterium]